MNDAVAPWSSAWRIALVLVTLAGMATCTAGVGRIAAAGKWLSPPGIAGSVLGIAVLGIVAARMLDRPLPFVASDRAAVVAVVGVAALKLAIGRLIPIGA